jgi:hypothetical protein
VCEALQLLWTWQRDMISMKIWWWWMCDSCDTYENMIYHNHEHIYLWCICIYRSSFSMKMWSPTDGPNLIGTSTTSWRVDQIATPKKMEKSNFTALYRFGGEYTCNPAIFW